MAARINTRFVLSTLIAVSILAGAAAAAYILYRQNDPTGNVAKAQEFYEQGNLRKAIDQMGRAINKDPGNEEYRATLERYVSEVTPDTRGEAEEYFRMQLSLLRRATEYFPTDADRRLKLIHYMHRLARAHDARDTWEMVENAADDMWERVPDDNPQRVHGRVYRSLGKVFRNENRAELEEAVRELIAAKEEDSSLDLAWEGLITAQLQMAANADLAGQESEAEKFYEEADRTIAQAREFGEPGPATTRIILERMRGLRWLEVREGAPARVTPEELEAQIQQLVEQTATAESWLVSAAAETLAGISESIHGVNGVEYAVDLLQRYLENDEAAVAATPETYVPDDRNRLVLANTLYLTQDYDAAIVQARQVRDNRWMTVSPEAMNQRRLKAEAAGLMADVAARKFVVASRLAEGGDPDAALAELRQFSSEVKDVVDDDSLILLRVEARLAHAEQRWADAARGFEKLLNETERRNPRYPEYLVFAAESLERIGQPGLAYRRISEAVEMRPNEPSLKLDAVRILISMSRLDAADELLKQIEQRFPEREDTTSRLRLALEDAEIRQGGGGEGGTEETRLLVEAENQLRAGESEAAIQMLRDAKAANPESRAYEAGLIYMLIGVSRIDEAVELADAYLEKYPNDRRLREAVILAQADPVEGMKAVIAQRELGEEDQAVAMVVNSAELVSGLEAKLARLGPDAADSPAVAKDRDIIARAQAIEQEWLPKAKRLTPNHPQLVEYEFSKAVRARDWAAAEAVINRIRNSDEGRGMPVTIMEGRLALARRDYRGTVDILTPLREDQAVPVIVLRGLGLAHRELGNLDEATEVFADAHVRNPTDREVAVEYIAVLEQRGLNAEALDVSRRAAESVPGDPILREAWLTLETRLGDISRVLEVRRDLYERRPDDLANSMALVNVLVNTPPTWVDARTASGAPLSRTMWESMSTAEQNAALEQAAANWQEEADAILAAAREENDQDMRIVLNQANVMHERGNTADAVALVKSHLESKPEAERTINDYLGYARFLHAVGRSTEALAELDTARPLQDEKLRQADLIAGQIAFSIGRFKMAIDAMTRVTETHPDPSVVRNARFQIAEAYLRLEEFDKAEAALTSAVDNVTDDVIAILLAARIAEERGRSQLGEGAVDDATDQFARASSLYEQAQSAHPLVTDTYIQHANFLIREHERTADVQHLDKAAQVLDRAEETNARDARVMIVRSSMYFATDQIGAAAQQLAQALELDPSHEAARRRLVEFQIMQGNGDAAIRTTEAAIAANDQIPGWHILRGDLLWQRRRDVDGAVEAYTAAYELSGSGEHLEKIVDVMLSVEEPDTRTIRRMIESHDEPFAEDASLEARYARALLIAGEEAQARKHLEHAGQHLTTLVEPHQPPTQQLQDWIVGVRQLHGEDDLQASEKFILDQVNNQPDEATLWMLAQAWAGKRPEGLPRAIELVNRAIEAWPDTSAPFYSRMLQSLGSYYLLASEPSRAVATFEQVVQLEPDNANALNNLAYLLATELDDPEAAWPFAERAIKLRPGDANMLDTAGWVQYRLGNYERARELLREAISIQETAEMHYHLAMVYFAEKDYIRARRHLVRAAEMNPSPDLLKLISKLDDELQKVE